jgi:hypothetical protein
MPSGVLSTQQALQPGGAVCSTLSNPPEAVDLHHLFLLRAVHPSPLCCALLAGLKCQFSEMAEASVESGAEWVAMRHSKVGASYNSTDPSKVSPNASGCEGIITAIFQSMRAMNSSISRRWTLTCHCCETFKHRPGFLERHCI